MDVTRRSGETPLQYHKRLVYGKLVDKTLSDVDYAELSTLVYGQPYSSCETRKMLYGSRKTLELMDAERMSGVDEDVASELDAKIAELQKEKYRLADQRREYNSLMRRESRQEHLYRVLTDAAYNLASSVGTLYSEPQSAREASGCEAVLVLCDWHYGMATNNVFNTYNVEICKQRVKNTVRFAKEKLNLHNCDKLNVVLLGDLLHGAIHANARVASEELTCDQLMQVSEIVAQSICELSRAVPMVEVYCTYGNHARTIQNKNDSIHRDNMERIIPWWLKQRLAAVPSVVFAPESENEFLFLDVLGHGIVAAHGDLDSVKSSPRLISTLFWKKYGEDVDYVILADKHHRESFEELGVTAEICGSLCGTDELKDTRLCG